MSNNPRYWALFYQDLLILTLRGPFRGPCRSKMVPWALVELNNDQISVGQPHPALGLKPPNNDRSQGHLVKALWIFPHPNLCHQYNTIGKPETEPCRYTSYIHQYVKKPSILAYIDMSRHISLFSDCLIMLTSVKGNPVTQWPSYLIPMMFKSGWNGLECQSWL